MSFETRNITDFSGGLYRSADPAQLQSNQQALLINGRTREGGITPIKLPAEIGGLPQDIVHLQGVYTADNYILVFADGRAYFRDYFNNMATFSEIVGFSMSPLADTIYVCLVPASTVNLQRKLTTATDKTSAMQLDVTVASSPACIVCQDGITQPYVIFPDGTARVTGTYAQWEDTVDLDLREYVPIGKQMVYAGVKLYVVAKDPATGRYNQILQSVSGRPLDFVVNVDEDGDKGGDAYTTAYQPTYSEITAVATVSLPSESKDGFLVSTSTQTLLVIPDFTRTIFGEPRFSNVTVLSSTGSKNQFSIIEDLLGDTTLIDATGIRSFNSIQQTRNVGQNTPFSQAIQPLFGDITDLQRTIIQDTTASIEFENYGFFSVKTVYGYRTLVFDSIRQVFVSVDDYEAAIGEGVAIKQWASIKTNAARALFFITSDNRLYQCFAGPVATCSAYLGDFTPTGEDNEQKPQHMELAFVNVLSGGTVNASLFLDSQNLLTLSATVQQDAIPSSIYIEPPFGNATNVDKVRKVPFGSFKEISSGWKVGFWVTWNFSATLLSLQYKGAFTRTDNALKPAATTYQEVLAMTS